MKDQNRDHETSLREAAQQILRLLETAENQTQGSRVPLHRRRNHITKESRLPRLARLAKSTYLRRARRIEAFGAAIFGEPAWDMLLDLYCHDAAGIKVTVSSAAIASHAPATTALRYISLLERKGFVERVPGKRDRRAVFLQLTVDGRDRLENYLTEMEEAYSLAA